MRGSNLVASVQSLRALGALAHGKVPVPATRIAPAAQPANGDAGAAVLTRCR